MHRALSCTLPADEKQSSVILNLYLYLLCVSATISKRGKIVQPVLSAGKYASGAKRGKSCNRCREREDVQPVPSAGNSYNSCQERENRTTPAKSGKIVQLLPRAGKHATGAKCGKTYNPFKVELIHCRVKEKCDYFTCFEL